MSLLTTFGILFETDAEKAKREIDGVNKSLSDTESTANDATGSLDDLGGAADESAGAFFGLSEGLGIAAAGLITVTGLMAGLISKAAAVDEIGKFSEVTGESIEDVGAWSEAVIRSGGSAEAFRGSLSSLADQLTDLELTGASGASEIFARLGIDAVDSGGKIKGAFEILPELAASFENLSRGQSKSFGQSLGLDQSTILLLQQGRVAVEELVARQESLGVATKEDAAASAEFNDALADSNQSFSNMLTSASTKVLPALTFILEGFNSLTLWMRENKTVVSGFFIATGAIITGIYLPAITSAAVATAVAIAPFVAIGLAVAAAGVAFALLYEDVVAYLGGQESFIGDLAEKYKWFGTAVDLVIEGVKLKIKSMAAVFNWLILLLTSPLEAIDEIGESFKAMISGIMGLLPDFSGAISNAFKLASSFFGSGDNEVTENLNKAIDITGAIDSNPLSGQTSASIVNSQQSSSRINNVNFGSTTVNTQATDAAGVASAVGDNLNNQISMAIAQFDDAEAY